MSRTIQNTHRFVLVTAATCICGCQTADHNVKTVQSDAAHTLKAEPTPMPDLQFLYFNGCPLSPRMRTNLETALDDLALPWKLDAVDLESLPPKHPLLRYGAPTVLVNGADLMGALPSSSADLSCRIYPDGVPTADEIRRRLVARTSDQ